jgi:thiol-disulfide isomerase/thioredoxin
MLAPLPGFYMKKHLPAFLFAAILLIFLPGHSYSQRKTAWSDSDYRAQIEDYWNSRFVKCGDSNYFFRRPDHGEDELYEVRGLRFETSGEMNPARSSIRKSPEEPEYPRNIDWSGSSIARFESSRKFVSRGVWEEWKSGGSEFVYFNGMRGNMHPVPGWPRFTSCSEVDSFSKRIAVGEVLPETLFRSSIENVDGGTFTLGDLKDKLILINLWATWCGPCRVEMPDFIDFQNRYKDKGLVIIGLDVDPEAKSDIDAFRKREGLNYMLARASTELHNELSGISQVRVIPLTLFIQNGRLVGVFKGYNPVFTKEKMEAIISSLLK